MMEGTTNFKPLRSGEAFAHQNGKPLTVSEDSYLLIPMKPSDTKRCKKKSDILAGRCSSHSPPSVTPPMRHWL